jgi:regulator of sigma E protease
MNSILISLVSVAVILGFMILIHEFGHYAVAKLLGVRVEVFSIGFGKRLLGFTRGETDYRIAAIPLGGYVKMSGENPMDERTGDPREFMSHSRGHRFLIAIAGPAMNILFAIFLLTCVYMVHYESPVYMDQPAVIGYIQPDSPAAKSGARTGDRIVQIDGVHNPTWEQVGVAELLNPNQPLGFTVQRDSQTIQGSVVPVPVTSSEVGSAGWYPREPVIVGEIDPGLPAEKIGLKKGDRIVSLDGEPVPSIQAMIERLQQTKTKPVQLEVLRDGKTLNFNVAPVLADAANGEKHYRLGFKNTAETKVSSLSLPQAFSHSLADNKRYSVILLELVGKMVRGKMLRSVSGPIGIAEQAGAAAQEKGWLPLLALTAGISLNLGIFNLLPIPIMDGGVILLLFIETLMRRDISLPIKERIYQAAFVFLVLFAAMVIYNDIAKTIAQRLP